MPFRSWLARHCDEIRVTVVKETLATKRKVNKSEADKQPVAGSNRFLSSWLKETRGWWNKYRRDNDALLDSLANDMKERRGNDQESVFYETMRQLELYKQQHGSETTAMAEGSAASSDTFELEPVKIEVPSGALEESYSEPLSSSVCNDVDESNTEGDMRTHDESDQSKSVLEKNDVSERVRLLQELQEAIEAVQLVNSINDENQTLPSLDNNSTSPNDLSTVVTDEESMADKDT